MIISVLSIIMMFSEACGTPKWQCPWSLRIIGLEGRRKGWNIDPDQGVINIYMMLKYCVKRSSPMESVQRKQKGKYRSQSCRTLAFERLTKEEYQGKKLRKRSRKDKKLQ